MHTYSLAGSAAIALLSATLFTTGCAHTSMSESSSGPITIERQGSFFVGGRTVQAAGTFDATAGNRAQLTGIITNMILPGTVLVADIDKAIDAGKGKAPLATMGGSTLTATKEGGNTVITDSAGHKATITQGDQQFSNGVVHQVSAVLMPAKQGAPNAPAVGQKAGK